jgi:hypothetical protein
MPVQMLPQQKPSTQYPDKHCDLSEQGTPLYCLHTPTPLQAPPQHSSSGSLSLAIGPQTPSTPWFFLAAEQLWQLPRHQLSQHTPSAQYPDEHCAALVHAPPFACFVTEVEHVPEPLQVPPSSHSLSGLVPAAIYPQEPLIPLPFFAAEHAWHSPMQMLPQHRPSTQYLDKHCAFDMHVKPL